MTASSSLLLIVGGEAVMRQTFREHGRAYWSAEFALILEKHGWLDFDTAGPEALEDLASLRAFAVVVVAWLPEDAWRQEYVEALRAYDGLVLLEGPFPAAVEELLGIERRGGPIVGAPGELSFAEGARGYIERRFGASFPSGHRSRDPSLILAPGGHPRPLELAPRDSVTRRAGLSRDAYSELEAEPFADNVGRAAVSITLAYRARFARNQRFFDDPVEDALAMLACVRCLAALPTQGALREAFSRLVREAAGSNRSPAARTDERTALARAIWGVALTEATDALGDTTFAERAKEIVGDVRAEWRERSAPAAILSRWRALLALRLSELTGSPPESPAAALIEAFVPPAGERPPAILAWLDMTLASHGAPIGAASDRWLAAISTSISGSSGGNLSRDLDGFTLGDLVLLMGALRRTGRLPPARRLWRLLLRELYDTRQGLFMGASVVGGKLAPTMGFATGPLVALGLIDAAGPIEIPDAVTQALEDYTPEQLEAWAAAPYAFQPYVGVGEDAVVTLTTAAGAFPALWRRDNVIATAFQLLGHLVHVHTIEPVAEPFSGFRSGDAIALEYVLIQQLGTALAARPPRSVQVAPWPWGVRYGLTVRHDVDRVLNEQQFAKLFEFERSHRLAVSWFWLPDRLEPEQLAALEREPRHEVALHAVRFDQKSRELELVGKGVSTPIVGEAIHGSGDGWLGHLSVRAAIDAGLFYTELAPPVADCPYARYPWVDAEGRVGSDRIIGVSYNISIEGNLGDQPGSEGGPGLYRQLLNHPDLNFDRLQNWVSALPEQPRVDWTCEQVARWWKTTHAEGGISIRHAPDLKPGVMQFDVSAPSPVENLELRIPCQPACVLAVSVDGREGDWAPLTEPEHPGVRMRISLEPSVSLAVELRYAPDRLGPEPEPASAARPTTER